MVQNPPEGYHTVTPYLLVKDAKALLAFAENAFGAKLRGELMMDPRTNIVGHAEMVIGNSAIMFADSMEGFEPTNVMLHMYVDDVDAMFAQAVAAGGEPKEEPADQFYGDRTASIRDTWGNRWYLATHKEDVSPEEMEARMKAQFTET